MDKIGNGWNKESDKEIKLKDRIIGNEIKPTGYSRKNKQQGREQKCISFY